MFVTALTKSPRLAHLEVEDVAQLEYEREEALVYHSHPMLLKGKRMETFLGWAMSV
jgi:hypothetical protein